jgi:hypothetical protein
MIWDVIETAAGWAVAGVALGLLAWVVMTGGGA